MELKPGYKQTEVGVIPEDWIIQPIANLVADTSPICYGVVQVGKHSDEGIPIVAIKHVKEIEGATHHMASRATEAPYSRSRVQAGDVLISIKGTIGRIGIVPTGFRGNISRELARLRIREGVCPEFVAFQLEDSSTQDRINQAVVGTTRLEFSIAQLRNFLIALPAVEAEQRAIAEILADIDAKIRLVGRLITKKKRLKQAAMQELLTGKRRLPGFEGEWEVKRLGEIGKCHRGVSYKGDADLMPHDTANTIRLLRSNNVQDSFVKTAELKHVNSKRVATHQILTRDDIVICMANGSKALVGKAGRFQVSDGYEYTFGAFMGCFRTIPAKADPGFAFYLLQTDRYQRLIGDLLAGSSINNLKPSSLESLEFLFPERSEQQAIAAVLSDIDAELTYLTHRRDSIQEIKQGMMQQLLTGKIRLT